MSIRFNPEEMQSVEKLSETEYECNACHSRFTYEHFQEAVGCPGCKGVDTTMPDHRYRGGR